MTDQFTRPCDGDCGDKSPHDSHLTAAGRARYTNESVESEKNIFRDSTDVKQLLGELAGFASVCWQEVASPEGKYYRPIGGEQYETYDRVFDSERASLAVDHAEARLNELIKENN